MEREVFWIGDVNEAQMTRVGQEIFNFYKNDPNEPITLYITSTGGSPNLAIAFYDFIRIKKIILITIALGECSSSALTVLLAGTVRKASQNTMFLEHQLSRHFNKNTSFDLSEINSLSYNVEALSNILRRIISEKTGRSVKEVKAEEKKAMSMTAEEAKEFGWIQEII